jgi:hypothetical protein
MLARAVRWRHPWRRSNEKTTCRKAGRRAPLCACAREAHVPKGNGAENRPRFLPRTPVWRAQERSADAPK